MIDCIIFDLDDTLIETCRFYAEKREQAWDLLRSWDLYDDTTQPTMDTIERENIFAMGFIKDRFPKSLGDVYDAMILARGRVHIPESRARMERIGWSVFEQPHPLIEGAVEVLEALRDKFPDVNIACCTKGDPEIQWGKLIACGLEALFDSVYVGLHKTPEVFAFIASHNDHDPGRCFVVGDSLRSDILPALAAGMRAIHIPPQQVWDYEVVTVTDPYHQVGSLYELLSFFACYDRRDHDCYSSGHDHA